MEGENTPSSTSSDESENEPNNFSELWTKGFSSLFLQF